MRKIKFVPLRRNRWNFISNLISNDAFDSRDCNLILITWLDEVTVPLTPEIEIFSGRVSKPRASINFLDTKFACDPQSYKARHVLREPSPSQTSTTAVEGMTYSLLNDPEAWIARTEGGGVALDATSLSVLLVDGSAAEGVWSSVLCLAWHLTLIGGAFTWCIRRGAQAIDAKFAIVNFRSPLLYWKCHKGFAIINDVISLTEVAFIFK